MTPRTRLDGRARSAAAALLAAVAVLGSLLAGPSVTAQASRLGSVAGSPVARAAAAAGVGNREHRDARGGARPPSRRGQREQSVAGSGRFVVGTVLRRALGHGTAPLSGVTAAAVLLGALVTVGSVRAGRSAPRRRRAPAAHRDRAPPALALA